MCWAQCSFGTPSCPPPLPPSLQIMVALRFYANGNFQAVAGDLHGISKASVSRIVNAVSSTLVALRRFATEILVMSMIRKPLGYKYGDLECSFILFAHC